MSSKKNICSEIEIPAQTGPICWFMSTFVAMFYSQRSKKILIDASKGWDTQKYIFAILNNILKSKNYDYGQHKYNVFEQILLYLKYGFCSKLFPYDPRYNKGFSPEIYIGKLYKLLNIDSIIFEYNPKDKWLAYSIHNEDFYNIISWKFNKKNSYCLKDKQYDISKFKEIIKNYKEKPPPPILIVIVRVENIYTEEYLINFKELFLNSANSPSINDKEKINIEIKDEKNIKSLNKNIEYMGENYTLDSIILSNWNSMSTGHAIAGITCENKHYIYNSWKRENDNSHNIPYACKLMEHDWIKNQNFCLNVKNCIPKHIKNTEHIIEEFQNKEHCFNFHNGDRLLIYIRNDLTSSQLPSSIQLRPSSQLQPSSRSSSSLLSSSRSSSSRSSSSRSSSLNEHKKSKIFELILMTMKMIINIITPFLNKNKIKLYTKMINIDDLENTNNLFKKFILMIILLFQKLVNEKIEEEEFKNEQTKLLNNIITESNNNLSHSRNTNMSLTKNRVSHIITTMYTHNIKNLTYNIIKDIPQNSRLYKKFNSLFHKFCLSICLIMLYAQVVGINEEEIFLMSNNNLIPSSRITQLHGGKQVKKSKKTPKKKPKNKA